MRRRRVRIRIRTFDAERRPSQCQRRPNADAERSPSASPPQRVNDDDLLCNGTAADENDEMADVFLLEDERPEGGEGGGEEGAWPPPRRPSVRPP